MAGDEVRVVKTETGHAGRGGCDYSISGKRIENNAVNFKGGLGALA